MRHTYFHSRPPVTGPVAMIAGEDECARFCGDLADEADDTELYTATQVMHPATFPRSYFDAE